MNITINKIALSPGQIEGANNLPVRTATWNTRTLKETDMIDILLGRMGITYMKQKEWELTLLV